LGKEKGQPGRAQQQVQESSVMEAKKWDSCTQVHFSDGTRGVDGNTQLVSNSSIDRLIVSQGMSKFQMLRNLRENYPCSDCQLSFCHQAVSPSAVPESSLEEVIPALYPEELTVYTRRTKNGKDIAVTKIGLDTPVWQFQRFQGGLTLLLTNLLRNSYLMARLVLLFPTQVVMKIWEKDLFGC